MTQQKQCRWYNVCPMKRAYEAGKLDRYYVETYCFGNWKECVRFQMEQRGEYHPDHMRQDGVLDESLSG